MRKIIEKFQNKDFSVYHFEENKIHEIITYDRKSKKNITSYKTNDERYAKLCYIELALKIL